MPILFYYRVTTNGGLVLQDFEDLNYNNATNFICTKKFSAQFEQDEGNNPGLIDSEPLMESSLDLSEVLRESWEGWLAGDQGGQEEADREE